MCATSLETDLDDRDTQGTGSLGDHEPVRSQQVRFDDEPSRPDAAEPFAPIDATNGTGLRLPGAVYHEERQEPEATALTPSR